MNFNRNNNLFNPHNIWSNPNNPNEDRFYNNPMNNNNGIPPLIQYPNPNIYQHNNYQQQNNKKCGNNNPDRRWNNFPNKQQNRNQNQFDFNNTKKWIRNKDFRKDRNIDNPFPFGPPPPHQNEKEGSPSATVLSGNRNAIVDKPDTRPKDQQNVAESQNIDKKEVEDLGGNSKTVVERRNSIESICAKNANDVTKKLFNRLKTMDKSNIKDIINNPKLQYETALKVQARQKLRQKMRDQLKILSEGENRDCPDVEADLAVDADKIPLSFIEEIGKTIDLNMLSDELMKEVHPDMPGDCVNESDEKAIEVVTKNLGGDDLLFQAEMLLMNSSTNNILDMCDAHEKSEENNDNLLTITDASDLQNVENVNAKTDIVADEITNPTNNSNNVAVFVSNDKPWEIIPSRDRDEFDKSNDSSEPIIISESPKENDQRPTNTNLPIFEKDKDLEWEKERQKDREWEREREKEKEREKERLRMTGRSREKEQRVDVDRRLDRSLSNSNSVSSRERDRAPPRLQPQRKENSDRSLSPNDSFKNFDSRRRDRGRDRDRERDRERERERERDRDSRRIAAPNDIWENPPERFKYAESNFKPIPTNSRILPEVPSLLSMQIEKPSSPLPAPLPTEKVEKAKCPDDIMSNVYRTKLNNLDPSQETPDLDSILKPKTFQFKGSFKRGPKSKVREDNIGRFDRSFEKERDDRSPVRSSRNRRSRSRSSSRTQTRHTETEPKTNSNELNVSLESLKPSMTSLKRMSEIDVEISKVIERMHGIDKVIVNLQQERNSIQKTFSKLQIERKQLLENVIKQTKNYVPPRSTSPVIVEETSLNSNGNKNENSSNSCTNQNQDNSKNSSKASGSSKKTTVENKKRKLDDDRKHDEKRRRERDTSKEPSTLNASPSVNESPSVGTPTTSCTNNVNLTQEHVSKSNSKPSKIKKDTTSSKKDKHTSSGKKVEKDHKAKKESETNNSKENSENPSKESPSESTVSSTIAENKQDKSNDSPLPSSASNKKKKPEGNGFIGFLSVESKLDQNTVHKPPHSHKKSKSSDQKIRKLNEAHLKKAFKNAKIQAARRHHDHVSIFHESNFIKVDNYKLKEFSIKLERTVIDQDILENYEKSQKSVKKDVRINELNEKSVKANKGKDSLDASVTPKVELMDVDTTPIKTETTSIINKPIELEHEEIIATDVVEDVNNYIDWTGNFFSHALPVVHIKVINNLYMICATEDGKIYKYSIRTGEVMQTFDKHIAICNSFIYDDHEFIYSVSSDGFMHKFKLKDFSVVHSENFEEPLQISDLAWEKLFIGSKVGNIYRFRTKKNLLSLTPLCNVEKPILSIKATKEGARKILIVSSKLNSIQVRDAVDGLLLRQIGSDCIQDVNVYDMLISGHSVFCGTSREEIYSFNYTSGALNGSEKCGNGAVCLKKFDTYIIAACYDGYIYLYDSSTLKELGKIPGPGNMLLSMDIFGDKIVASTKDKSLKIIKIPKM